MKSILLKSKFLFFCFLIFFIWLLSRCDYEEGKKQVSKDKTKWFQNLADSVHYVGMQACRQCHEDIYQNFIKTGMGQSFGLATKTKSAGNYKLNEPVYDASVDMYYYPYWKNNNLLIKEFRLNKKDTVYQRNQKINYIIGSGQHTNSHMYNINGYVYQIPLTFYTQKGEWNLPPGFENGHNSRFSRPIELECMSCHNSYPQMVKGSINKYKHIPMGIECERCHGPGELHIKTKKEGKIVNTKKDTDFTIVNPAKLPYKLQIDVCQRCHLQGNAILKEGKSFTDFKPGMPLSDVFHVFMPVYKDTASFYMASHPERLKRSKCFTASRSNPGLEDMTCITCHNPHYSVKFSSDKSFNLKCESCHNVSNKVALCSESKKVREANDNNCIHCHMRRSSTVDIPHVTITDHYIRIPENMKSEKKENKTVVDIRALTPDPGNATITKAYLYFYEKFQSDQKFLDSAFIYLQKLKGKDYFKNAVHYYFLSGKFNEISSLVASNKGEKITEPIINYQVGQAFTNIGEDKKATSYFEKAVSEQPYNLNYRNKLASNYLSLQKLNKAEGQLRFINKENPLIAVTNNNLGFIMLVKQEIDSAEYYFKQALKLNPDYGYAHLNMAKVYLGNGKIDKAVDKLNEVEDRFPELSEQAKQIKKLISN